jgi:hypothetical protein
MIRSRKGRVAIGEDLRRVGLVYPEASIDKIKSFGYLCSESILCYTASFFPTERGKQARLRHAEGRA